jgi:uncharacterized protein (TIGR02145 family)
MRTKLNRKGVAGYAPTMAAGILLAMAFTFISCSDDSDDGDGGSCDIKDYKTVKIGDQTWMAENLNCNVSGSKCYDNDNDNCKKYGRLYDWATAMALPSSCNSTDCSERVNTKHRGICPSGWHISSYEDWETMYDYIENSKGCTDCAILYMALPSDWGNGTCGFENTYGFAALPGGSYSNGNFQGIGNYGYWWYATENPTNNSYRRYIFCVDGSPNGDNGTDKSILRSVRCVMD